MCEFSEVEEVGEDLAHLGERPRADVADRTGEPFDGDCADVLALRPGDRLEPVARIGFDGHLGPLAADGRRQWHDVDDARVLVEDQLRGHHHDRTREARLPTLRLAAICELDIIAAAHRATRPRHPQAGP